MGEWGEPGHSGFQSYRPYAGGGVLDGYQDKATQIHPPPAGYFLWLEREKHLVGTIPADRRLPSIFASGSSILPIHGCLAV